MATPKVRSLIAKLLRLAESPEPEEAARAREQAEQLMTRHGLTESDFDEVTEVVDEQRDELRERLARAVGISRRAVALCSKKQIAFRGRPVDVKAARQLYQSLITEVTKNSANGPYPYNQDTWCSCYWIGFVETVIERLIDDEARAWKPPEKEALKPAAAEMQRQLTIDPPPPVHFDKSPALTDVRRSAYAYGRGFGQQVHIEPRPKREERPALAAAESEEGA